MKFLITFLFFIINNFILNLNALKSDFHVEVVPKEHSWNIKIFCQECLNEKYKKVLPKDYVGTTFTLEHEEGISGLHVVIKSTEKILGHQRVNFILYKKFKYVYLMHKDISFLISKL
ncbi:unnamed protein product [Meloidogyne enterolobii]|uniref:Uncharacterized protein n=1 Tax=Meloidogyne enterolobii TaxID=390850 RepID=A0ACB0XKN7_MELEN